MANLFNSIRIRPPKLNRFDLSHDVKLTAKFGKLVPILCQDVLPGDVYKHRSEILVRMAPMLAPIMTQCTVYTHFFFVPKRLVWSNWKDFITGGEDGESSPSYPRIQLKSATTGPDNINLYHPGSLADYLGFPVLFSNTYSTPDFTLGNEINKDANCVLDALPFRAYQLIYNEYYRDQNLMSEIDIMKDSDGIVVASGRDSPAVNLLKLRNRCWKKDYFTSALPWAQRGDEVELPINGTADLLYNNDSRNLRGDAVDRVGSGFLDQVGRKTNLEIDEDGNLGQAYDGTFYDYGLSINSQGGITVKLFTKNLQDLIKGVDLSGASSATINELRRAIKAQEFLEVAARGGSRYIEQIYAYFGVRSSDARLQRPEFIGGGKSPIVISDVLQTSQSTETSAQATPSGHGISVQNSHTFKYRSEEHGYIIGIMSIMPKAAYMQGMPKNFTKFDRLDYYWPQFAHLGEQEIMCSELFSDASSPYYDQDQTVTFGYTPRYAEYKFAMDRVCGDFRESLNFWHMGRIFGQSPRLNEEFLTNVESSANRVFNVVNSDVDKLWINVHHNMKALRKMPKYGTPLF